MRCADDKAVLLLQTWSLDARDTARHIRSRANSLVHQSDCALSTHSLSKARETGRVARYGRGGTFDGARANKLGSMQGCIL